MGRRQGHVWSITVYMRVCYINRQSDRDSLFTTLNLLPHISLNALRRCSSSSPAPLTQRFWSDGARGDGRVSQWVDERYTQLGCAMRPHDWHSTPTFLTLVWHMRQGMAMISGIDRDVPDPNDVLTKVCSNGGVYAIVSSATADATRGKPSGSKSALARAMLTRRRNGTLSWGRRTSCDWSQACWDKCAAVGRAAGFLMKHRRRKLPSSVVTGGSGTSSSSTIRKRTDMLLVMSA